MYHKQNKLDWWSDRAWIKFGCLITAVITILILVNWGTWSPELKIVFAIAALIPVHVIEEWVFPGGFHYQYNLTLYRSKYPDRYPMCRVSDMITNLAATFFYIILGIISLQNEAVSTGLILGTIGFCALEVTLHTVFGIKMYFRFKDKGKTTIYGPGSITAYLGFGVFGAILFYALAGRVITGGDIAVCLGILAFIAVVCILIPENLLKNHNNKYGFRSNGYFDRFLK